MGRTDYLLRKDEAGLIVGLDIGTSKVIAIVGEVDASGDMTVVGMGSHPSRGLKKGVVVNIEATVQSIQRAVEQAEQMASCKVHSVYAGIGGSHIRSLNSHGVTAIRSREVTPDDIARVIDAARVVAIPADQKVLHILPREFVIDNQEGIHEPVGMSGVRLEAKVHLVTGAVSAAQNIVKCVQRCGLEVDDVILEQLASSRAVLTEDEKELGVCLIDIGAGTIALAVYTGGAIAHTAVIPIAGDQVTNDIAIALRTPTQHAEEIKVQHGCCMNELAGDNESLEVAGMGERAPRRLSRQALVDVVRPRYQELFELVQAELQRSGQENAVAAGIVITGGSARMIGVAELAEDVFHLPVRTGTPQGMRGLEPTLHDPVYATAAGLLLVGNENRLARLNRPLIGGPSGGVLARMKNWFMGNF